MMSEGMMHFLADVFDERREDIESDNAKDSSLADEFSIIKTNMMKIRQLFDILERDFRVMKQSLHLEEYRELLNRLEEIIPRRKIIKFGMNFRIGIDDLTNKVNVETYDTVAEDLGTYQTIFFLLEMIRLQYIFLKKVGEGFQEVEDST
jgi:inositol 1,4,5-triphosphate receptor type 1